VGNVGEVKVGAMVYDACTLARWDIIRLIAPGGYLGLVLGPVCSTREREERPLRERGVDGSGGFSMLVGLLRK